MAKQKKSRDATKAGFPTREEILAFVRGAPGKVGKREIAKAFHIKGSDRRALRELLSEMQKDGLLTGNRKEIRQPGALPPVTILEIAEFDDDGYLVSTNRALQELFGYSGEELETLAPEDLIHLLTGAIGRPRVPPIFHPAEHSLR